MTKVRVAKRRHRLKAFFYDFILMIPVAVLGVILRNGIFPPMVLSTLVFAIPLIYFIYYHSKFGQTLGKKWVGIKVVSLDSADINLKQSLKRHAIDVVLRGCIVFATIYYLAGKENSFFSTLWIQRENLITNEFLILKLLRQFWVIWFFIELIVLLLRNDRRTIHDLIGNTQVVYVKN